VKVAAHRGRRTSAREVRLVLDHARPLSNQQWADVFKVHLRTIKIWRAKGMLLGLWSAPASERWDLMRAEAIQSLADLLHELRSTKD
jgi:hypothetical protein